MTLVFTSNSNDNTNSDTHSMHNYLDAELSSSSLSTTRTSPTQFQRTVSNKQHDDNCVDDSTATSDLEERLQCDSVAARMLNALLQQGYTEAPSLFSDQYLSLVTASRSFAYAQQKLIRLMQGRRNKQIDSLLPSLPERVEGSLRCGSLYWYGYDKVCRPILWVRSSRKDWSALNVDCELEMHILMLEVGISFMPAGVEQFTIISDSAIGWKQIGNIELFRRLIDLLQHAYPDRLAALRCGPVNAALKMLFNVLYPFLPKSVVSKIQLMTQPTKQLKDLIDEHEIPNWLGGCAVHDFNTNTTLDNVPGRPLPASNQSLSTLDQALALQQTLDQLPFNFERMVKYQKMCLQQVVNERIERGEKLTTLDDKARQDEVQLP